MARLAYPKSGPGFGGEPGRDQIRPAPVGAVGVRVVHALTEAVPDSHVTAPAHPRSPSLTLRRSVLPCRGQLPQPLAPRVAQLPTGHPAFGTSTVPVRRVRADIDQGCRKCVTGRQWGTDRWAVAELGRALMNGYRVSDVMTKTGDLPAGRDHARRGGPGDAGGRHRRCRGHRGGQADRHGHRPGHRRPGGRREAQPRQHHDRLDHHPRGGDDRAELPRRRGGQPDAGTGRTPGAGLRRRTASSSASSPSATWRCGSTPPPRSARSPRRARTADPHAGAVTGR